MNDPQQSALSDLEPTSDSSNDEQERRRRDYLRADINLPGCFATTSGDRHECLVMNISASGALLRADYQPSIGDTVRLNLPSIGQFRGKVVRVANKTFAIDYSRAGSKTAQTTGALLDVVKNATNQSAASQKTANFVERRQSSRVETSLFTTIFLENDEPRLCEVIELSLRGASLAMESPPPVGAKLRMGKMHASVFRQTENGVVVMFTGSTTPIAELIGLECIET